MRAYLKIQFDRPIIRGKHYISPGGYCVSTKEKTYEFDFLESAGGICQEPDQMEFDLRDEDLSCFPEINELKQHFGEVEKFDECFVYTGDEEDEPIGVKKILEFWVEVFYPEGIPCLESTDFIKCIKVCDQVVRYVFTEALLQQVNSDIEKNKR